MRLVVLAAIVIGQIAATTLPSCDVLSGWTQSGVSRLYEGDNLYEYMDGNSEGYLIYGFVRMRGVTCVHGPEKVLIDVSEMQDAESAYGLFSSNRDVNLPVEPIGANGQVVPRKAIFVKDKYFVEIAAESQGDHSVLLSEAAKALALCVPGDAAVPKPVGWFPSEGLTAGPPRLVPESVLGIRILRRGYIAQYGQTKAFVVSESSAAAASATMEKLRARFAEAQPAKLGDEAFEVEDKYLGRICIARRGRRLIGYANVPPATDAVGLTAALLVRVPE